MLKNQEIKMVLPKIAQDIKRKEVEASNYALWFMFMVIIYFALLLLISLLPLSECMKILSLILGTFLVVDILHSIKYYVKYK